MVLQLVKTTPYLSGQQRIDIELKPGNNGIIASDKIHVVPLSDNIIYNENDKHDCLDYSHRDNLKFLYNKTFDTFWKDVKCRKDTLYYIDENDFVDLYDHTYQAGTRRIRYERYNKQFSCLVPLWIDSEWNDNWCFRIKLTTNSNVNFSTKYIVLSDKLKKYLKDYFNGVTSELLNINSERKDSAIKGLNVEYGVEEIKDVSYIYDNITSRERPLMEFDSSLCELFSANHLIAKQLLNLNFVFNIEDVISPYATTLMTSVNNINISIEFGESTEDLDHNIISFTPFQLKDIYTNYDIIPVYYLPSCNYDSNPTNPKNVLDYLEDNKAVDLIYNNKTTQPICHWTLVDNPNYIYNFYEGFAPYYGDRQVAGSYYGTPYMEIEDFNEAANNIGWCKRVSNTNLNNIGYDEAHPERFAELGTRIYRLPQDSDTYWMEWLKYQKPEVDATLIEYEDEIFNIDDDNDREVYIRLLKQDPNHYILGRYYLRYTYDQDYYIPCFINYSDPNDPNDPDPELSNKILISLETTILDQNSNIIADGLNMLTIKNIKKLDFDEVLNSDMSTAPQGNIYDFLFAFGYYLLEYISQPIPPIKYVFDRSIIPVKASSKSVESTEIKYLKANFNNYSYVYRYTGHLQPMFIDTKDDNILFNTEWKCKSFSNVDEEYAVQYNEGIISKEKPLYPSIGYFPLSKVNYDGGIEGGKTHYSIVPEDYNDNLDEYIWFNKSKCYILPAEVNLTIQLSSSASESEIQDAVIGGLKDYLGYQYSIDRFIRNIFSLYNIKIDFEYASLSDINHINYYIKYKLK